MLGRAFTLVETAAVLAVGALGVATIAPALTASRCAARDAVSQANLKQIGEATAAKAADDQDRIFNFDWQNGVRYTLLDGSVRAGNPNGNLVRIHQAQQANLLWHYTGRIDGPNALQINSFDLPYQRFRYLMIVDYLSGALPEPIVASPHDANLIRWQADKPNAAPGGVATNPPPAADALKLLDGKVYEQWPYASSYLTTVYSWSADRGPIVEPSDNPNVLSVPNSPTSIALRTFAEVIFPSQKVQSFEQVDGCRGQFWGYDDSSVPQLSFDGSVRTRLTGDANPGWDSRQPENQSAAYRYNYYPVDPDFFPPARFDSDGDGADDGVALAGRFLWTRGGLEGVDYGGDEIDTSNWND